MRDQRLQSEPNDDGGDPEGHESTRELVRMKQETGRNRKRRIPRGESIMVPLVTCAREKCFWTDDQGPGGAPTEQEVCLVEDIDEMSAKDSRRTFVAGR
jgi:hypothetical protein